MWMKYVDREEAEGEHFEVYEKTLTQIDYKMGLAEGFQQGG
jgi:hypothetical protein